MTIYGTQLLLPFTDHPFAIGSVFIIDPLYTVPLILGLVATGIDRGPRRLRWNALGVALSTPISAGAVAAGLGDRRGAARSRRGRHPPRAPAGDGDRTEHAAVARAGDGTRRRELRRGLLVAVRSRPAIRFDRFASDRVTLFDQLRGNWGLERMAWFSHGGFFKGRASRRGGDDRRPAHGTGNRTPSRSRWRDARRIPEGPRYPTRLSVRAATRRLLRWLGPRMLGADRPAAGRGPVEPLPELKLHATPARRPTSP